jgi:outer membrane receptor protein involved in Fe transport
MWQSKLQNSGADRELWRLLPRASIAAQVTGAVSLRAAVHRAYRTPTINELYRPFRVGNVLTQANASLGPEESIGLEGSVLFRRGRTALRTIAFWTRLDDAVVNVTLSTSPALILRERQNAGRIRAAGLEFEADVRLTPQLAVTGAVALIDSVFVEGAGLDGLRVPQVPRWQVSAGLQGTWRRVSASLDWRFIGEQFDDDRNQLALDRSTMINARAGWRVRPAFDVFVALENAFDQEQDVGRTPLRTLGIPRTAHAGIRWKY